MGSVRKKGNKWYFSIELPPENGKRRRIERAGGKTKKEALQKMALLEAEILNKGYKEKSKITFKELSDMWLKEYAELNYSENTKASYIIALNNHILPEFGGYKVTDLNTMILQSFINKKFKAKYSSSTIRIFKTIINSILDYAVLPCEIVDKNPAKFIKIPNRNNNNTGIYKNKRKEYLTIEEFNEIINSSSSHIYRSILILIFNTGLRTGEAVGLQWQDIDFENRIIHVRHSLFKIDKDNAELVAPKTQASIRDIYFNDTVYNLLKKQSVWQKENKLKNRFVGYTDSDLVFTRRNGMFIYTGYFAEYIKKSIKKTGINFSLHTLRHTHATMLLQAGVNVKEIQARLGHSDISTTLNIYTSSTDNSKKDSLKKFDEYIEKTSDI